MHTVKTLTELLEDIDENMKKILSNSNELMNIMEDLMEKNKIGKDNTTWTPNNEEK